jgi:hypothetical protein
VVLAVTEFGFRTLERSIRLLGVERPRLSVVDVLWIEEFRLLDVVFDAEALENDRASAFGREAVFFREPLDTIRDSERTDVCVEIRVGEQLVDRLGTMIGHGGVSGRRPRLADSTLSGANKRHTAAIHRGTAASWIARCRATPLASGPALPLFGTTAPPAPRVVTEPRRQ